MKCPCCGQEIKLRMVQVGSEIGVLTDCCGSGLEELITDYGTQDT
jgi:hypothetical protein